MLTIVTFQVNSFTAYGPNVADSAKAIGLYAARLLQKRREELGISMEIVADRAGISRSMISLMERGLRKPTLDILLRISAALDTELWPIIREAESSSVVRRK